MRLFHPALAAPLISLMIAVPSWAETLRITNGEWPPFTSQNQPHGGPLSRTVAEAFKQAGITVEYGYFPWKRAYDYARSGAWDGSVGWARNAAHLKDFVMSEPVLHVDKVLFYRKATPIGWLRVEDLKRWRLGATAGYSYGDEWDDAVRNGVLRVETVTLDAQNLRKLLENRLDAVAMDLDVGLYQGCVEQVCVNKSHITIYFMAIITIHSPRKSVFRKQYRSMLPIVYICLGDSERIA